MFNKLLSTPTAQFVPNQPQIIDQIAKARQQALAKYNLRQLLTTEKNDY